MPAIDTKTPPVSLTPASIRQLPRWFLALGFSLVALFSFPTNAATVLRAADTQSADYPTVLALNFMAKRVAEMTDGELRLKVYPARQLGEEKDTILATLFGAIDINRVSSAPLGTMVPEVIMMSGDRWDRLSGEQQKIILQAAKEAELMMRQLWRERVEQASDMQARLTIVEYCLIGAFGTAMAWYGLRMAARTWDYMIPSLAVPMGTQYLALVASGAAIALFVLEKLFLKGPR